MEIKLNWTYIIDKKYFEDGVNLMPSVFFWFTPTSLFEGFCRSRCASSSRRRVFVVEVFSVSGLGCLQLGSLSSSFVSPAIYGGSAWSLFKGWGVLLLF